MTLALVAPDIERDGGPPLRRWPRAPVSAQAVMHAEYLLIGGLLCRRDLTDQLGIDGGELVNPVRRRLAVIAAEQAHDGGFVSGQLVLAQACAELTGPDATQARVDVREGYDHALCLGEHDLLAARSTLRRYAREQRLLGKLGEVEKALHAGRIDIDSYLHELQEAYASERPVDDTAGTLAALLDEDPADEKNIVIPTGSRFFDDAAPGGGLQPGLAVFGGPPGVGKTGLALQLALGALTHNAELPAVWCAGEMSPQQLRNRALANLAALTIDVLRRPWAELSPLQEQAKRNGIEQARTIGRRLHFLLPPLTPERIEQAVVATGAGLVVIDYLQVARVQSRTPTTRREEVDAIIGELCRLAQSRDVAVFVISDMPKGGTTGRDIFDAFKETSEIAYAADLCYVAEFAGEPEPDQDDAFIRWRCLKARHGRPVTFCTRLQRSIFTFEGVRE